MLPRLGLVERGIASRTSSKLLLATHLPTYLIAVVSKMLETSAWVALIEIISFLALLRVELLLLLISTCWASCSILIGASIVHLISLYQLIELTVEIFWADTFLAIVIVHLHLVLLLVLVSITLLVLEVVTPLLMLIVSALVEGCWIDKEAAALKARLIQQLS